MMPNKKRDDYVDIAKGLCIILIVVIHSEVMGYLGMVKYTYFAVPLFFYMSGFYDKSELSWTRCCKKNSSHGFNTCYILAFYRHCI